MAARQFAFMLKYRDDADAGHSGRHHFPPAELLGHSAVPTHQACGKYADIIAVASDPIRDVRALETVSFVMKDGKVYKQGNSPN